VYVMTRINWVGLRKAWMDIKSAERSRSVCIHCLKASIPPDTAYCDSCSYELDLGDCRYYPCKHDLEKRHVDARAENERAEAEHG
jgi:hypothetical protein